MSADSNVKTIYAFPVSAEAMERLRATEVERLDQIRANMLFRPSQALRPCARCGALRRGEEKRA